MYAAKKVSGRVTGTASLIPITGLNQSHYSYPDYEIHITDQPLSVIQKIIMF